MAQSRQKTRRGEIRSQYIRHPLERERVSITFDPDEGRTHQSFKEECDIDKILDLHARTGIVNHLARGEPQYGDAPDITLFESAVAQAEIRSAVEDGWTLPEEPQEPESSPDTAAAPAEPNDGQAASQAAEMPTEG